MRVGDDLSKRRDPVLQRHDKALLSVTTVIARSVSDEAIQSYTGNSWIASLALAMTRHHAPPSRTGGWNDNAVSQGRKIQVSCETSVMKVSTSGRPCGLA